MDRVGNICWEYLRWLDDHKSSQRDFEETCFGSILILWILYAFAKLVFDLKLGWSIVFIWLVYVGSDLDGFQKCGWYIFMTFMWCYEYSWKIVFLINLWTFKILLYWKDIQESMFEKDFKNMYKNQISQIKLYSKKVVVLIRLLRKKIQSFPEL